MSAIVYYFLVFILYYTILYYIILYYTVLYYTVLSSTYHAISCYTVKADHIVRDERFQARSPRALGLGIDDRYGSFRKLGVPYLAVLIVRILLFRATTLGFPIFGNPHMTTYGIKGSRSLGPCFVTQMPAA